MMKLGDYSKAVFLIKDDVRCIACAYELKDGKPVTPLTQFKSFDKSLKPGDYVTVPTDTRVKMTVVKVVEVDVEPDLTSHAKMDWIIGKVDPQNYENLVEIENQAIEAIKAAETRKMREEMRSALFHHQEETMKEVQAAFTNPALPPAPPPIKPLSE